VYRELRERAPVTWLPEHRAWFVATYEGVRSGFRDERLTSDRLTPLERRLTPDRRALLGDTFELLRGWMVFHDPPAHERLRQPVARAFTPRAVARLRPFVEQVVDERIDLVLARLHDGETVDLIAELAFPVPAIVIAELLGVPASDRDEFKSWSRELAALVFGGASGEEQAARAARGSAQFVRYFTALIDDRRKSPRDDLISALVDAAAIADPPMSPTELVGACTLLLFGGHETTTNLVANSIVTLLDHPAALADLRRRPDAVATAAEELHRFDGTSKVMVRIAAVDHPLDGVDLHAGDTVFLGIASANRDPAAFDRPDELLLDRPDGARHLGYGYGLHHCLGAPLARLESEVALHRFVTRLGGVRLAMPHSDLAWGATILGRGPQCVPVVLDPSA
jgi:cytochrome P450